MYNILIVDDDHTVAEAIAMGITAPGRRLIVCHDLPSASIVIERERIDSVVADIRFGGMFSYEGLDLVDHIREERPECQIILMTGMSDSRLETEGRRRGAAGFLNKPFSMAELDSMLEDKERELSGSSIVHVPDLDQLIGQDLVSVSFQPIVHLSSQQPAGYEALARIRTDSLMGNPEILFEYATRSGRLLELESHCLERSISDGVPLARSARLFLNVHPSSFENPRLVGAISRALDASGVDAGQVVLEITEQGELRSDNSFRQIDRLRELGLEFALDDIGVAFSHLPYIDRISPRWMKVSNTFGTGFEADPTKLRIVHNLADLANSFGASLILEGVEAEETADAALQCGIEYAQGYFFARPAPVSTWYTSAGSPMYAAGSTMVM